MTKLYSKLRAYFLKATGAADRDLLRNVALGYTEDVAVPLSAGANPNVASIYGTTPLYEATLTGNTAAVTALLNAGANPDAADEHCISALYRAADRGNTEIVTALLDAGATPDAASKYGITPLYVASTQGHAEAVTALLNHGADPNERYMHGVRPLHCAAENGNAEAAMALLHGGADPDAARTDNAVTPLHLAVAKASSTVRTPFYLDPKRGRPEEVVTVLLDAGANLHAADRFGKTPCHWAGERGNDGWIVLQNAMRRCSAGPGKGFNATYRIPAPTPQ